MLPLVRTGMNANAIDQVLYHNVVQATCDAIRQAQIFLG